MASGQSTEQLLQQFVKEALISKSQGLSTKLYDQLLGEYKRLKSLVTHPSLTPASTAPQECVSLIAAITRTIALVDERKHEVLLTEVLDTNLWRVPAPVRVSILDLITHAVVANGALVQTSLHTLVYALLPPPAPPPPDPSPGEAWLPQIDQIDIQNDVLSATEKSIQLVPTAAPRMLPLLLANFPHKLRDRNIHCLYLRALIRLAEGPVGATLREPVLSGIIDHLITVDVDIKWEDIAETQAVLNKEEIKEEQGGEAKPHPTEQEPDIFDLEGMTELDLAVFEVGGGDEGEEEDDAAAATRRAAVANNERTRGGWEGGLSNTDGAATTADQTAVLPAVDETADKLDSLMELTIGHVNRRVAAGQLAPLWDTLMTCFERTVLHTHRSKFTQFILFHVAKQAPADCSRVLIEFLLSKIGDTQQPPITRSASAAYAASFLARAAYVPSHLMVDSLQRVVDWCLRYTKEEDCRGGLAPIPSTISLGSFAGEAHNRHAAFFAACQALLYVLCYHMAPLLKPQQPTNGHASKNGQNVRKMMSRDIPMLLAHSLDPLASCAVSVVREFGRQAWALGFPELGKFVRTWERKKLATKHTRPLEVFFPFDPYLLRRSALLLDLDTSYLQWRHGHAEILATAAGVNGSATRPWGITGDDEDVDDADLEGLIVGDEMEDSDLDQSSSSGSSDDDDDSSDDENSSSDEGNDTDDLKRTRFGSIAGSSLNSGDGSLRHPHQMNRGGKRRAIGSGSGLRGQLRYQHMSGVSPSMGIAVPGSLGRNGAGVSGMSTDNSTGGGDGVGGNGGSPWGASPVNGVGSFAPMSLGR